MARPKKLSDSELLHVAYDVGSREGFDSFTLRQVARRASVSPAAVIKRFKSKSRLVALARHERWESTLSHFNEPSAQRPRGLEGIRQLVSTIAASVDSKRLAEHARAFGAEARDRRSRERVGVYFARTRAVLTKLLREALADDELARIEDVEKIGFTLEALIQGGIFQFAFLREPNIEEHLQNHVRTFLAQFMIQEHESHENSQCLR